MNKPNPPLPPTGECLTEEEAMKYLLKEGLSWKRKLRLRENPEDLRQAVCLKLWEGGKWPPPRVLANVAMKNHCLNEAKRPEIPTIPLEEGISVAVSSMSGDRQVWLQAALKGFTWTEQKAVRLRLQGMTLKEVSKHVDLHPSQVKRVIDNTAEKLKEIWDKT